MNNIDKHIDNIQSISKKLLDNKRYDFDNIIDYFSFFKSYYALEKEQRSKNKFIKK